MLSPEQKQSYDQKGFFRIPGAFSPEEAGVMVDRIWASLENRFTIRREDRSTWTLEMGYGFSEQKKDPAFHRVGSAVTLAAIDDLLGEEQWIQPSNWGQLLVTFPESGGKWTIPAKIWHSDFDFLPPCSPFGVMVFGFLSDVGPGDGGTVVVENSHRLVENFVSRQSTEFLRKMKRVRLALMESQPWLRDLATAGDPDHRRERFSQTEVVDGVPVRVTELTGKPGDVVLCQPWLLHAVAPNCGKQPRMMCVQRIHSRDQNESDSSRSTH